MSDSANRPEIGMAETDCFDSTISPPPLPTNQIALHHYLEYYTNLLDEEGVEEIMINQPGELFIERTGKGIERIQNPDLTLDSLEGLATLIATYNHQSLEEGNTLLSASLPNGERVQIILPPSCEHGKICFAIRKPNAIDRTLASLEKSGVFDHIQELSTGYSEIDQRLLRYKESKRYLEFFKLAVESAKNIVISGGTSSGKTTFANALLKYIPEHERIITIEDVREIHIIQKNKVHLLASKGGLSVAEVDVGELFAACLRLRPDRIMLSEIRGSEAYDFLNSVTSGHPGSITTIHADSVQLAIERLARYVGDHESGRNIENREEYICKSVAIIVQMQKDSRTGWRGITNIFFQPHEQSF